MLGKWRTIFSKNKQTEVSSPSVPLVEAFFNGKVIGKGVLQSRFGKVINHFTVEIEAKWQEETATFNQHYLYLHEGLGQQRTWHIVKTPLGYEAYASNLLGAAKGASNTHHIVWRYKAYIPMKGRASLCTVVDHTWFLSERRAMNRVKIKKYGFVVAEMFVFLEKIM